MKILIAEDDHHLQSIIEVILRTQGHSLFCVSDGQQALDKLMSMECFDLALVDLNLPALSGAQILEKLQGISHCPVVMMSASADQDTQDKLIELGALGFIGKPFAPQDLIDFVESFSQGQVA